MCHFGRSANLRRIANIFAIYDSDPSVSSRVIAKLALKIQRIGVPIGIFIIHPKIENAAIFKKDVISLQILLRSARCQQNTELTVNFFPLV